MRSIIFLIFLLLYSLDGFSQQKSIAITIDDVPNTSKFQESDFRSVLLDQLDSMDVPFTIFINESKIFQTESTEKNMELLDSWIAHENSTIGNHSYSHLRYSDVGFARFVEDIQKGEILSDSISKVYGKSINTFRFPFNDMGKDSIEHKQIGDYLTSNGYAIAPFTVESSDWMFDAVYRHYLENGEEEKARKIGKQYVQKTLELLSFFEDLTQEIYGRFISHIYLCHDNAINADYLREIVSELNKNGYEIIGYEESLRDPVYNQIDHYYQKWGVSWLYRWMDTQTERVKWMKQEPSLADIEAIFNSISSK
ncbi:polysaccharide deacetylase family protein [Peijinzhouia sedimentorum]